MPANYVLLEKVILTTSAASVVFDNIPQTGYTDLKVVCSTRFTSGATGADLQIKLNTFATDFTYRFFSGSGSAAQSSSASDPLVGITAGSSDTANIFGNTEFYIPNYTSSNTKSISSDSVTENNATLSYVGLSSTLWNNTAAITSITLFNPTPRSFAQHSTFSLYGLAAVGTTPAIAPFASGGDTVVNDGTYWYHAFLSSGTFIPQKALTCDTLVVAGGGGSLWGGGGAGGLRGFTSQSFLKSVNYSCLIGAGGTVAGETTGKGNNSSLIGGAISISATGGGKGGSGGAWAAGNGGSGGGGGNDSPYSGGTGNEGGYSPVEGYAGGTATGSNGAGGGGATAAGSGKNGGAGSSAYSSWASATSTGSSSAYAGGGGGGAASSPGSAGTGGGGAGSTGQGAVGAFGTGGGAGGGWGSGGNTGGSGIVIIRYPMA